MPPVSKKVLDRGAPIIGIGRLFVLVSKTTKMLLTAVHIDDTMR